ncbi:hypothetical protein QBC46DRAFT_398644 [Diplogelasinospora grovesii]|uniref:YMC020W-like alpha/beta hydrolase domain-containing protein n=1 Tax=Diplogelasinospora grovesii TaxID=303347 RepID=A0AAN6RYU9_9PEZI|nr:hypothetical protein QBC46DRAFT_398644 [Diplogelasinospora grovesii]
MGPRKRAKPNPTEGSSTTAPITMPSPPSQSSQQSRQAPTEAASSAASISASTSASTVADRGTPPTSQPPSQQDVTGVGSLAARKVPKQIQKRQSWYGSWPRVPKSSASTQVARETIMGGTLKPKATADFSRFDTKKVADSMSLDGIPASTPSLPNIAESRPRVEEEAPKPMKDVTDNNSSKPDEGNAKSGSEEQSTEMPPPAGQAATQALPTEPVQGPSSSPGWFGWFGRAAITEPTPATPVADKPPEPAQPEPAKEMEVEEPAPQVPETAAQETPTAAPAPAPGSYWFGFWSSSTPALVPPSDPPALPPSDAQSGQPAEPAKDSEDVVMHDAPPPEPPIDTTPAPPPKAGSTWAFWSRDTGSKSSKKPAPQEGEGEAGHLAVIGESSESHPERANSIGMEDDKPVKEPPLKPSGKDEQAKNAASSIKDVSSAKSKRGRPQSMDIDEIALPAPRPTTPKSSDTASIKAGTSSKTPTAVKSLPPNLLLPSFNKTYKLKDNPSILRQIAQLLHLTQQPPANHVFLSREPAKIKKALAIGVHGLFPANYLRTMIGQPTGTSIKFANHCAEAIRRWADAHGCENCEIEKVALEGEGKIGERVENLWKLLLNWIDQIRKADLILLGCHSQGVPVSIMLLAKLIELGIITSAKVGVCAMAGVSLGPFPDYRSSMGRLMGSAAELWEFGDPESEVSQRLEVSIKAVLNYGCRITFVGSIDDQLVPLESAIYSSAHHPYIYRAVFIDGRIHAPDFIAHLVGFALKLRNLGISDHGLIRELSLPLAGSLYSGEGHSRLYDDEQVYDLAVLHALETTDVPLGNVPECKVYKQQALASQSNPYHLPWIMRGLLEEDFVKTDLSAETAELVKQFDDWKPVTKALKDVKYRLEAVRSKL